MKYWLLPTILTMSLTATAVKASPTYQLGSINNRPSYITLYEYCARDPSSFRQDYYLRAYQSGITTVVGAIMLDDGSISTLINNEGKTQVVEDIINSETGPAVLKDCLGDKEFAFVRNLLLAEGVGKFVGISIGVIGFKGMSKVFGKLGSKLSFMSAATKKKALVVAVLTTSALQLKSYYKRLKSLDKELVPTDAQEEHLDIREKLVSDSKVVADENIRKLNELLLNPELTEEENKSLRMQIDQWEKFKKIYV